MNEQLEEQRLTLYDLQAAILQATDDLEKIDDPEVAKALDEAVARAMIERGDKLDRVAYAVFDAGRRADEIDAIAEARAKANRAEEERLRSRAVQIRKVLESITNTALRVLLTLPLPKKGVRTLEGNTSTFKAKKGRESVELYDDSLVPRKYCGVTITMSFEDYCTLTEALAKDDEARATIITAKYGAPSKTDIKRDLEKLMACPCCHGTGFDDPFSDSARCRKCAGVGQVPNEIPGARLLPAKYSVEIS